MGSWGRRLWRIETEFETEKSDVEPEEYETRNGLGGIVTCPCTWRLVAGVFLLSLQQAWGGKDAPVKVLLYGYCTGVASSRRIAQRLHEDIAFRVLAANNTPDFRNISDFRKDHLAALAELFYQVLELCRKVGLVKLGHVAPDSIKVRANSSKHKAMSYGRIKEREAQLKAEVDELLRLFRFGACLPGRKRGNGPAGAAAEQRGAVIILMIGRLAQRWRSPSSATVVAY